MVWVLRCGRWQRSHLLLLCCRVWPLAEGAPALALRPREPAGSGGGRVDVRVDVDRVRASLRLEITVALDIDAVIVGVERRVARAVEPLDRQPMRRAIGRGRAEADG